MPKNEQVLCFRRSLLDGLGHFNGLDTRVERYLPVVTSPQNIFYLPREEAEQDFSSKQLIPYILLVCGQKILRYERGKRGQETRLHGLLSIGIGGHIAQEDGSLAESGYETGMLRELSEEAGVVPAEYAAVGLLNDDTTEVGRVHFGVVHLAVVPNEQIMRGRAGIVAPQFVTVEEALLSKPGDYESWSQFCLPVLPEWIARFA